jgi:hypothetical protein
MFIAEIARAFIFSMRLCLTLWLRDRIASPCTHRLTRFAHNILSIDAQASRHEDRSVRQISGAATGRVGP